MNSIPRTESVELLTVNEINDRIRSLDESIAECGPIRPLIDKRAEFERELARRSR